MRHLAATLTASILIFSPSDKKTNLFTCVGESLAMLMTPIIAGRRIFIIIMWQHRPGKAEEQVKRPPAWSILWKKGNFHFFKKKKKKKQSKSNDTITVRIPLPFGQTMIRWNIIRPRLCRDRRTLTAAATDPGKTFFTPNSRHHLLDTFNSPLWRHSFLP